MISPVIWVRARALLITARVTHRNRQNEMIPFLISLSSVLDYSNRGKKLSSPSSRLGEGEERKRLTHFTAAYREIMLSITA
jgi:hypothetical protein